MNTENKDRLMHGLQVLALFILGGLAVGAAFGCFNYATLAKKTGEPDNIFWLVGILNLAWNGYVIYMQAKKMKEARLAKQSRKLASK